MRYYKVIKDGYIFLVGTNCGGEEITEQEYNEIMQTIRNKPIPPEGCDYKLTVDLKWELFELPIIDEKEDEMWQ